MTDIILVEIDWKTYCKIETDESLIGYPLYTTVNPDGQRIVWPTPIGLGGKLIYRVEND